jgi:drug/metabolite transporter (DMT)-like permease
MTATSRPASWKILLAFSIIYLVWGSTFLAIRIGVHEVPPLLLAAIRFFVSGLLLLGWMRLRRTAWPSLRQWGAASVLGLLIFVIDYGCLFWAEQRVPSGIAAVILATIPVFVTVFEIALLRTQRLTVRLALALTIGLFGVAVLMNRSFSLGEVPIDRRGAVALLIAALTWSFATIITRRLPLPDSKPMSAAAQMFSGGIQLFVLAGILGEWHGFRAPAVSWNAWFSLVYLIIAGSIVGFTAYVWLLHYESPTKVGSYAYVNPVVAVALGYFLAGETVGVRTLIGTVLVLVSVVTIMTTPAKMPTGAETPLEVGEVA